MATPINQPPRSRPTAATDQPAETPSRGEVTAAQEVQRVEHVVLRAADGGQRGDSHGDEDAPQPHADALTCAVEARHAPGDVAAEEVSDGEHDEQRDPAGEADGLRLRAVHLASPTEGELMRRRRYCRGFPLLVLVQADRSRRAGAGISRSGDRSRTRAPSKTDSRTLRWVAVEGCTDAAGPRAGSSGGPREHGAPAEVAISVQGCS